MTWTSTEVRSMAASGDIGDRLILWASSESGRGIPGDQQAARLQNGRVRALQTPHYSGQQPHPLRLDARSR